LYARIPPVARRHDWKYDGEASLDAKLTYAVNQWAEARRRDP